MPSSSSFAKLRRLQRIEGVAHYGEHVRLVRADRLLRAAGLRTVRQAGRMQRDRADVDALARAELAGDVRDHLLRLEIRVVIRDRHRERSKSSLRGQNEQITKFLPSGTSDATGRLVDAAGDRLEVVHREGLRIKVRVPSHRVQWAVLGTNMRAADKAGASSCRTLAERRQELLVSCGSCRTRFRGEGVGGRDVVVRRFGARFQGFAGRGSGGALSRFGSCQPWLRRCLLRKQVCGLHDYG